MFLQKNQNEIYNRILINTAYIKSVLILTNYELGHAIPADEVVLKIVQLRFPEICLSNAHSHISNNPESEERKQNPKTGQ